MTIFKIKVKIEMMPKQISAYFLAGLLFIIGLGLGFYGGQKSSSSPTPQTTEKGNDNNFYSSQNAFIRGKITQISGNNLTVTNLNSNATGNIAVSDRLIITKPGAKNKNLGPSDLETGKEVLINLAMIGGKYQAISIQYVNPAPSLTPNNQKLKGQATQSATP